MEHPYVAAHLCTSTREYVHSEESSGTLVEKTHQEKRFLSSSAAEIALSGVTRLMPTRAPCVVTKTTLVSAVKNVYLYAYLMV